jgi:uncharacterized protein (DUF1015 family)
VLFPGNELKILPYNRAVKDLNCLDREEFLKKVGEIFTMKPTTVKTPTQPGQCCMYLKDQWYLLEWKPAPNASPIDQLDVSILQDRLLKPVLGIDDPRTSKRIDFIGGIRGTAELEKLVNGKEHTVAFSMYPTTVDQLMAISDVNAIMPPKSTWFEPKLRSGLFIHAMSCSKATSWAAAAIQRAGQATSPSTRRSRISSKARRRRRRALARWNMAWQCRIVPTRGRG